VLLNPLLMKSDVPPNVTVGFVVPKPVPFIVILPAAGTLSWTLVMTGSVIRRRSDWYDCQTAEREHERKRYQRSWR
jgi:hypothetical protein